MIWHPNACPNCTRLAQERDRAAAYCRRHPFVAGQNNRAHCGAREMAVHLTLALGLCDGLSPEEALKNAREYMRQLDAEMAAGPEPTP